MSRLDELFAEHNRGVRLDWDDEARTRKAIVDEVERPWREALGPVWDELLIAKSRLEYHGHLTAALNETVARHGDEITALLALKDALTGNEGEG